VVKHKIKDGKYLHGLMRLQDLMCGKYGDGCGWEFTPWRYFKSENLRAKRQLKNKESNVFDLWETKPRKTKKAIPAVNSSQKTVFDESLG